MHERKLSREDVAAIEVGQTRVAKILARIITCCFLALIFMVPVGQQVWSRINGQDVFIATVSRIFSSAQDVRKEQNLPIKERIILQNDALLAGMAELEDQLEEESYLREVLLVPVQKILLHIFNKGNEKVYPGKDGWLFYSKDVEYLIGGQQLSRKNDPVEAIVEFRDRLREDGIELLLVPTPVKPSIHPEKFSSRDFGDKLPLYSTSHYGVIEALKKQGVQLFDPAPLLIEYFDKSNIPAYLETDTHWTPAAMEYVAERLGEYIEKNYQLADDGQRFKRLEQTVAGQGDVEAMLQLSSTKSLQEVTIHQINTQADELWQSSASGSILLLGDSFSNIYSMAGMHWGQGAGFAEQLSYYLGLELDTILQNDAGAYATREKLARDLGRGKDRLQGKQLVIWQFAAREFSQGDWKSFTYQYQPAEPGMFYVVPAGEKRRVTGEIAAISRSPRPGSVPYKDNIITLYLENMVDMDSGEELGSSLVYSWGMRDNRLEDVTSRRNGDVIVMELVDWLEVEEDYSSYRRSTLDDEMIEYELPNWGVLLP